MGAIPDRGEGNDWFVRKRLRSYADAGSYVEDQNVKDILSLIAASNQQAVQKALEGLLEQKSLVQRKLEDKPLNGEWFPSWEAVPVSAIESVLAAAQPRKDGDEK